MSTPDTSGSEDRTMPTPGDLARTASSAETVQTPVEQVDAAAVVDDVRALLAEVDEIRESVGDEFNLAALARQTALLEQAHEALTAALDEVDRR